jgi:hypothetical protein
VFRIKNQCDIYHHRQLYFFGTRYRSYPYFSPSLMRHVICLCHLVVLFFITLSTSTHHFLAKTRSFTLKQLNRRLTMLRQLDLLLSSSSIGRLTMLFFIVLRAASTGRCVALRNQLFYRKHPVRPIRRLRRRVSSRRLRHELLVLDSRSRHRCSACPEQSPAPMDPLRACSFGARKLRNPSFGAPFSPSYIHCPLLSQIHYGTLPNPLRPRQ